MRSPRRRYHRTLAIVAVTVVVGCSSHSPPATTPPAYDPPLRIYATSATLPLLTELTGAFSSSYTSPSLSIETRSGNYRAMLERLLDGETPFFVSNHLPVHSPLWAAPLAQDGIAVIVHRDNPVSGLTTEQLRALYQGQVANWRELGGPDLGVVVVSREDGAGTRAEFEQQVMGQRRTTLAARIAPSSVGMVETVSTTPGAVGYVSLAFVDARVRALAINGVVCTLATVTDNTYPLRATVFVVGLEEPQGLYRTFIGWAQGMEGQAVVRRRYAPLLAAPVGD